MLDDQGYQFLQGSRCIFSWNVETGCGAHPASCSVGIGVLLGVNRPCREADHSLLVPRLWINGALPPLPLYAFMACEGPCGFFVLDLVWPGFEERNVNFSVSAPWSHIGGVEVRLHSFVTLALDRGEWLTGCLGLLTPGKEPRSLLSCRPCGPQNRSGLCGEVEDPFSLPVFEPGTVVAMKTVRSYAWFHASATKYMRSFPVAGYYAAYCGKSSPTFRDNLSIPSSRARNLRRKKRLDSCPLQMGPIGCPEMSVRNYHYTLRNIPDLGTLGLARIAHWMQQWHNPKICHCC